MGGMLGDNQDFKGNGEDHELKFAAGNASVNWGPYYAVFVDPFWSKGDPFYLFTDGNNPSHCPEMVCGPPETVVAKVSGFPNLTRVGRNGVGYVKCTFGEDYSLVIDDVFTYGWDVVCPKINPLTLVNNIGGDLFGYRFCTILYELGITSIEDLIIWRKQAASIGDPCTPGAAFGLIFEKINLSLNTIWPKISFNGEVPKQCFTNSDGRGGVGGVESISYAEFYDTNNLSLITGYYQSNNKNKIHYTRPNFFNPNNRYNGTQAQSRQLTWQEVLGNTDLKKILNPGSLNFCYGNISDLNAYYESDGNGTYICHREIHEGLRPELIAKINKTKQNLGDEAELIFEVGGREIWGSPGDNCCAPNETINGFDFGPGEILNPEGPQPDGRFYGVDYACGPRIAYYDYIKKDGQGKECSTCDAWYCWERIGTAKPHLNIYAFDHSNYTASLKLNIKPNQWMVIHGSEKSIISDDQPSVNYYDTGNVSLNVANLKDMDAIPYTWIVDSVEIIYPGKEYKVGMFFYVDFDPSWFLPWVNGQIITAFPDVECCDPACFQAFFISWRDKYGYFKRRGQRVGPGPRDFTPDIVYQRLRVTEVDDFGGIVSLEVVPWYKNPEYNPPNPIRDVDTGNVVWHLCNDTVKKEEDKKKYYVEYTRILCHPNSVRHPGKEYSVGDTITWDFPTEKNTAKAAIYDTWKNKKAIAVIVDVDEQGGILDWYISGSDRWKQYGVMNLADGAPCYRYADQMIYYTGINQTLETDDRGRYRFIGYKLCTLNYQGIGVPVRRVGWAGDGDFNTSNVTVLNIGIIRENCRTTAGISINRWPFSGDELLRIYGDIEFFKKYSTVWYLYKFPPYPLCQGGGLEIEIILGADRANDSVFGSTVKSAKIISRGIGYAYKEKKHVAPNLLREVPDITSLDSEEQIESVGSGALLNFSFTEISNFPNPAVIQAFKDQHNYTINPSRFSYFSVSSVSVEKGGKGYQTGQRFDVWPIDRDNGEGGGLIDFWSFDGGDNPDIDINGSWYTGDFAEVDNRGYMAYIYDTEANKKRFAATRSFKQPQCTLEISKVDKKGAIESIKIIERGTMFRPVWTTGVKHPDAITFLTSSLGYGAIAESIINTNIKDNDNFGSVSKFWFRGATIDELPDPYYSYSELKDRKKIPGNDSLGYGRDYATPSHGYYWQLEDVSTGPDGNSRLLAYYDWGLKHSGPIAITPLNYLKNPSYETHRIVRGSRPPFIPMTTVCSFKECYHDLLNRTYPLYKAYYMRQYNGFNATFSDNCEGGTWEPFVGSECKPAGPPGVSYCVAMRKIRMMKNGDKINLQSKIYNEDCTERIDGAGNELLADNGVSLIGAETPSFLDYYVVEFGPSLQLSSVSTSFGHVNGRTIATGYDGNAEGAGTGLPNT